MADRAQRTIRVKWVRSGIGLSYRQKDMVRSLGLRRLNQVVERPDTPQMRGLVARIPHLVEIVEEPVVPARISVPEYTLFPPEVAPAAVAASTQSVEPLSAPVVPSEVQEPVAEPASVPQAGGGEEEISEPSKPAKTTRVARLAKPEKKRAAKSVEAKKSKAATGKSTKPSKTSKK